MKLIHVVVYKLTLYILIVKLILDPKKPRNAYQTNNNTHVQCLITVTLKIRRRMRKNLLFWYCIIAKLALVSIF